MEEKIGEFTLKTIKMIIFLIKPLLIKYFIDNTKPEKRERKKNDVINWVLLPSKKKVFQFLSLSGMTGPERGS